MAKRRTRKDKENAKHQYSISWNPGTINSNTEANVKGQNTSQLQASLKKNNVINNADKLAQIEHLARIKKDIFKSMILAIFIIGIELVLYFVWQAK